MTQEFIYTREDAEALCQMAIAAAALKRDAEIAALRKELEAVRKLADDESEKVIALRFEMTSLKVTIGHLYDKYNAWPVGL